MKRKRIIGQFTVTLLLLSIMVVPLFTGYCEVSSDARKAEEQTYPISTLEVKGSSGELTFNEVHYYPPYCSPTSFHIVSENEIYFGDAYSYSIKHYVNGVLKDTIKYPENIYLLDFCINDNKLYIFDDMGDNIVVTDMSGTVIESIPLPKDSEFITGEKNKTCPTPSRVSIENGILTIYYIRDIVIKYIDNEWKKDEDAIGIVQDFKSQNMVLIDKHFQLYTVSGLLRTDFIEKKDNKTYVFTYEITEDEKHSLRRIYRISEKGDVSVATLIDNYSHYMIWKFYMLQDGNVYQMLFDKNRNARIVKIPFVDRSAATKIPPRAYWLDISEVKFDKVEAFTDGDYVDVTDAWNSFQKFISHYQFLYFEPVLDSSNQYIEAGGYRIRFTKDNEVYYGISSSMGHNSFGGHQEFRIRHDDTFQLIGVSNIDLFCRAFGYIHDFEKESWDLPNTDLLKVSVYDMMCDSPLLIRKMNRSGDLYYWGQEKYAVVSAIANHYTKTLEQKPDDLRKYGIIRNYTYVYSSETKVDVTIYALSLWQKGLYAHIRIKGQEVWLVLDTCVKDIQAVLNNGYNYRISHAFKMDSLILGGYDKATLIYNDKEYDITNMWPMPYYSKGFLYWNSYTKADPLETDCKIILEKEGKKLVLNVARTYEYVVVEGKGLYHIPYLESLIDAVAKSDLHKSVDALVSKSILYKMFRASCNFYSDRGYYTFSQNTFEPVRYLLIRYLETLPERPDEATHLWETIDLLYKSENIKMSVWRTSNTVPGPYDTDIGYVNITSDGTDIWFKIREAYSLFSYRGCEAVDNPWILFNLLPEYVMVPDSMSK